MQICKLNNGKQIIVIHTYYKNRTKAKTIKTNLCSKYFQLYKPNSTEAAHRTNTAPNQVYSFTFCTRCFLNILNGTKASTVTLQLSEIRVLTRDQINLMYVVPIL